MSKRSRRRTASRQPPAASAAPAKSIALTAQQLDAMIAVAQARRPQRRERQDPFRPALHPPAATPPKASGMAMDDVFGGSGAAWGGWGGDPYASVGGFGQGGFGSGLDGIGFLGFQYLSELAQRPEYRRIAETISRAMTRKWIKFTASGKEDKSEKIAKIDAAFKRLRVKEVFQEAAAHDCYFGRSHVFMDFGDSDPHELTTSVGDGFDDASKAKVGRGSLKRLKNVEAIWTYPQSYNTTDPLRDDHYVPQAWYVMGRQINASRMLTFVGREVSDMWKPAYSFGGVSLSQLARPYVENWLDARQSVSDLLKSFSVNGIKIDLAAAADATGSNLERRIALFTELRDNRGTMVLNTGEEFFNVSTPLGTTDKLQAQSLENICSITGIPIVVYTGNTPSGLNASSEGEIDVWHDFIAAYQGTFYGPNLHKVLTFVQLSEFGEVDPGIGFEFLYLGSISDKDRADLRKANADTDEVLVRTGTITRDEARARVAKDADTPYPGLDLLKPVPAPETERIDNATKLAASKIAAHEAGLTSEAVALKGLADTGLFPEITAEVIAEADDAPPRPSELDESEEQESTESSGGIFARSGSPLIEGAADEWVTVHPNGSQSKGQHVEVSSTGTVTAGMGGKFNGKKLSSVSARGGSSGSSSAHSSSSPAAAAASPKQSSSAPTSKNHAVKQTDTVHQKSKLTEQQAVDVKDYKEGGYRDLNNYLRGGKVRESLAKEHDKTIKRIDDAIGKSELKQDTTLYRGIQHAALSKGAEKLIGKKIDIASFQSTSTSKETAQDFAGMGNDGVLFHIHAPAGTKALALDQYETSNNAGENEVLLGRGGKLHITHVDRSGRVPVIHARLHSGDGAHDAVIAHDASIFGKSEYDVSRFVIGPEEAEQLFGRHL